jgi:hypothetical protein
VTGTPPQSNTLIQSWQRKLQSFQGVSGLCLPSFGKYTGVLPPKSLILKKYLEVSETYMYSKAPKFTKSRLPSKD